MGLQFLLMKTLYLIDFGHWFCFIFFCYHEPQEMTPQSDILIIIQTNQMIRKYDESKCQVRDFW